MDARPYFARNGRLLAALSDEGSTHFSRAFLARRMDGIRHLDRSWIGIAIWKSSGEHMKSFRCAWKQPKHKRVSAERERSLVYTFAGEALGHR